MKFRAGIPATLLLLVLAGGSYAGSVTGGYVYDDVRFVERNPAVTEGAPLSAYFLDPGTQAGDGSVAGIWRPLRTLSFALVHSWFGPSATPQRIGNLLLHLVNGLLVWLLLRSLAGERQLLGPLLGALFFVLSPLAAEPVAWVTGRGDLLAVTGLLAAAVLYLRGGAVPVGFALLAFAFGLLGKESAAVLPFLLVLLSAYRGGWAGVRSRARALAGFFLVLGLYLAARFAVMGSEFAQGGGRGIGAGMLLVTVPVEGLYYLRAMLFPVGLSFEYHLPTALDAPLLGAGGAVAAALLVWLAVYLRRRAPAVSLAVGWFLVALAPVTALQVLFPLKILVANRFAYPALAAGAILTAWVVRRGRIPAALAVAVLLCFVPLTAARAAVWRSDTSLWRDVVAKDPKNGVALYGLGLERAKEGRWGAAADLLVRSARADPGHPGVAALLGDVLQTLAGAAPANSEEQVRELRRAFEAYHTAIRLWQGGSREELDAYRPALAQAAYLALVNGRLDLATDHVRHLLSSDTPLPGPGPARNRFLARVETLAMEFRRGGEADVARRLARLHDSVEGGGDR